MRHATPRALFACLSTWMGVLAGPALLTVIFQFTLGSSPAAAQPYAYVASAQSNSVAVVDTRTATPVTAISVRMNPGGVAVSQDGSFVFVTAQSSNNLAVINAASNAVVATVTVGTTPTAIAVMPAGDYAYVVNQASNNVSVVSKASSSVMATVPVGMHPSGIAITPDGSRAYVANTWSNQVSVINTGNNSVSATIDGFSGPAGVAITSNGAYVYVTNQYGNSVAVVSTASNTIVATIPVGGFPNSISLTPNGSRAYVTNGNESSVSVVDTVARAAIATIGVGLTPTGVAITPDGTRAYVSNALGYSASVIDTGSNTVIATLDRIGIYPIGVAIAVPVAASAPPPPPPSCSYSVSLSSQSFGSSGGSGSATVTAGSGCAWTAASGASWISVGAGSGSGSTTIGYTVASNPDTTSRSGAFSIAGQSFTITQAGAAAPPPPPPPPTVSSTIRINAGGSAWTDAAGRVWSADSGYTGGSTFAVTNSIANTDAPAVYQSERYGTAFSYQFSVPGGSYTVRLRFAEIYFSSPGQRVFNVAINGTTVLANFDVVAQAGGPFIAVDREFPVSATSGSVNIQFSSGPANMPMIKAIEIVPASASTSGVSVARVNAGGGAFSDSQGQLWSADNGYTGGSVFAVGIPVNGTTASALYQTERYGAAFSYQFTVPNGNYTVKLKFAEIYFNSPGQRVFNVAINGSTVLANFDIVAQAGGGFIAMDKSFPVSVTGGQISIQFTSGSANLPKVSGIEIVQN